MATDQYHQEAVAQNDSIYEDVAPLEKWNSLSSMLDGSENTQAGGFDCNICLDSVQDPVITLCGHLYCWPCIYKWIHFQNVSTENFEKQNPQCPVCKAEVSQKTLVPLYGRGKTTNHCEGKSPQLGIVIPNRPPSPTCSFRALITNSTTTSSSRPAQQVHHRGYTQQPQMYHPHSLSGPARTNAYDPMIGMFGEMVYTRIFGNSETTLYTYPNSYNLAWSNSPRVRRHVMQADRSLGRMCFFLCCCVVFCLLLF